MKCNNVAKKISLFVTSAPCNIDNTYFLLAGAFDSWFKLLSPIGLNSLVPVFQSQHRVC